MADQKEYADVSRSVLECLKKDLQSMGINPPEGDTGDIEYQGVKLSITYHESDQRLAIQVTNRPSFVPESLVWQLLDGRVQKCMGK
ncbi:MAG TPA: hypothetical protein VFZ08_14885 [Terriglobia bacterium]|nr:hypothetical protein [Terriglobia bacterium]